MPDPERQDLIDEIEMLYPPDHNEEGRELLMTALCSQWRSLPLEVLRELRYLNVQRDHRGL